MLNLSQSSPCVCENHHDGLNTKGTSVQGPDALCQGWSLPCWKEEAAPGQYAIITHQMDVLVLDTLIGLLQPLAHHHLWVAVQPHGGEAEPMRLEATKQCNFRERLIILNNWLTNIANCGFSKCRTLARGLLRTRNRRTDQRDIPNHAQQLDFVRTVIDSVAAGAVPKKLPTWDWAGLGRDPQ